VGGVEEPLIHQRRFRDSALSHLCTALRFLLGEKRKYFTKKKRKFSLHSGRERFRPEGKSENHRREGGADLRDKSERLVQRLAPDEKRPGRRPTIWRKGGECSCWRGGVVPSQAEKSENKKSNTQGNSGIEGKREESSEKKNYSP